MSALSRYETTGVHKVQMFTVTYSTNGTYISFDFYCGVNQESIS